MESPTAGEGNSPSTSHGPSGVLAPPFVCDGRRAYGQLVARELAELRERERESDPLEQHALHTRVRRWWSQPQRGANLPMASRA